ncbi:flagellar basal body-associated FliL family protein [Rhizobium sp. G187]|uniref:flagellar basal body-associated FliL family protein n=1 Tax=unclassified Rhizobium TaxID=2613769 RepID=UPI0006B8E515|nr:flagellar basal body-associated FliL family protein [Rhizobium sp. AAP43]KPF42028.1 hypothetical protein IP76_18150 [Rhizobium sp. AAP43]
MGKLLGIGLWVCIVTLGAVYGSIYMATAPKETTEEAAKPLELVPGEAITVPVLAKGGVTGYFLTRISFMIDKEKMKGEPLPLTELMTDQLFTMLTGEKMVDLDNVENFDLEAFRGKIKTEMNARLGGEFIDKVLIEQIDYVSQAAARRAAEGAPGPMERTKIAEEKVVEEKAPSGH